MSDEEIKGNRLIMFFDGARDSRIDILGEVFPCILYNDSYYPEWNLPEFNKDWNLLMPVLDKIEQCKYSDGDTAFIRTFNLGQEGYMVRINGSQLFTDKERIKAAWLAAVDFIQWYQNQSK